MTDLAKTTSFFKVLRYNFEFGTKYLSDKMRNFVFDLCKKKIESVIKIIFLSKL